MGPLELSSAVRRLTALNTYRLGAIAMLGIEPLPPAASIARDAARIRGMNVSLADGFCLASASARRAAVASFDHRVRKAAARLSLELAL